MKLIRLTAFTSIAIALLFSTTSCEKNAEKKKQTDYQKNGIVLTSAQENNPANTSSALGSMDVFYTKETRILTYSVTWSGLTGPVTLMHIHGQAPRGFNAGVVQNIITPGAGTGLFQPGAAFGATGKVSGTLLVDGVIIKEQDLLNGFYYMNIHTAVYGGGEIRGQIVFQ